MTSPAPLTEAQKAAAEALSGHQTEWIDEETGFACSCDEDGALVMPLRSDAESHQARAVVAAVHDVIAAKALIDAAERVLDQADRVRVKFGSVQPSGWNRTYGLSEAASMLRADAQSLSLPASKETPDGN